MFLLRAQRPESRWALLPGIALSVGIAVAAKLGAEQIELMLEFGAPPSISPVMIAVLLGVLWRSIAGLGSTAERGVQWTMQTVLRVGIALVGLRLTVNGMTAAVAVALPVAAACICVALTVSLAVGKVLNVPVKLRQLLAVGTAVCGCTAIVAAAPVIRARPVETGLALSCAVSVGCVGMLVYPWLAGAVFGAAALPAGVFLGTAIHDTSQVIGASVIYAQQFAAPDTVAVAGATKLLRNLAILVLVPLAGWWTCKEATAQESSGGGRLHRAMVFPGFVVWFIVLVIVRSLADRLFTGTDSLQQVWLEAMEAARHLSELLLVCGMTAVGLSISWSEARQNGWPTVCTALVTAASMAACSFALTYVLSFAEP